MLILGQVLRPLDSLLIAEDIVVGSPAKLLGLLAEIVGRLLIWEADRDSLRWVAILPNDAVAGAAASPVLIEASSTAAFFVFNSPLEFSGIDLRQLKPAIAPLTS